MRQFNDQLLSSLAVAFSKSENGSPQLWKDITINLNDRIDRMDTVGLATMINAIGRSKEISLSEVIPHYRGVIMKYAHKMQIGEWI